MGPSCRSRCKKWLSSVFIAMCFLAQVSWIVARPIPMPGRAARNPGHRLRGLRFLVEEETVLDYHNGTVLTGSGGSALDVYIIWYGNFSDSQRSIVHDFFASTQSSTCTSPSVAEWWHLTSGYEDSTGAGVPPQLLVLAETSDAAYSKGKHLQPSDLQTLVTNSLAEFPADSQSIYMVLTADDVLVAELCNSECGSHYATDATMATKNKRLAYGWVANPGILCPGKCAWPFSQPMYGPYNIPLLSPNGDIGMDGLVINLGTVLAGVATNPFNTGYFQGEATAPYEAASACVGMFGPDSYPGYPGELLSDNSTGASFNTWGVNGRKFLLPALWDPVTMNCSIPT